MWRSNKNRIYPKLKSPTDIQLEKVQLFEFWWKKQLLIWRTGADIKSSARPSDSAAALAAREAGQPVAIAGIQFHWVEETTPSLQALVLFSTPNSWGES